MQTVQTEDLVLLDRQLEELSKTIDAERELLRQHLRRAGVPSGGTTTAESAPHLLSVDEVLNCISDRRWR